MKKTLFALLLSTIGLATQAQVITQFTWENNPPTQALVGPNATSIGSTSTVTSGGSGGTNGLNPGTTRTDIDMVLPGSTYTPLTGIDISVDFKREESQASFFTLGNMDFGMNGGALYVQFAIVKGATDTLVNATNLYSLPSDNAFHTYHFIYNNFTGTTTVSVDGTTVYTYHSTPGASLYWTGAGNATVGNLMDGGGSGLAVLDNLVIQKVINTLPLDLLSFDAASNGNSVDLKWTTTHEFHEKYFSVERSTNGIQFDPIGKVATQEGYEQYNDYQFTDNFPAATVDYYRIKMVNTDGSYSYSPVKQVTQAETVGITCYPNPVVDYINVRISHSNDAHYQYTLITIDGRTLQTGTITVNSNEEQASLNLTTAPKGVLLLHIQNPVSGYVSNFKVMKM